MVRFDVLFVVVCSLAFVVWWFLMIDDCCVLHLVSWLLVVAVFVCCSRLGAWC